MNYDEAMNNLENSDLVDLREWCYDSHKDFYGVRGHWYLDATKEHCLTWIKEHFLWDCDSQSWRNAVPFLED